MAEHPRRRPQAGLPVVLRGTPGPWPSRPRRSPSPSRWPAWLLLLRRPSTSTRIGAPPGALLARARRGGPERGRRLRHRGRCPAARRRPRHVRLAGLPLRGRLPRAARAGHPRGAARHRQRRVHHRHPGRDRHRLGVRRGLGRRHRGRARACASPPRARWLRRGAAGAHAAVGRRLAGEAAARSMPRPRRSGPRARWCCSRSSRSRLYAWSAVRLRRAVAPARRADAAGHGGRVRAAGRGHGGHRRSPRTGTSAGGSGTC